MLNTELAKYSCQLQTSADRQLTRSINHQIAKLLLSGENCWIVEIVWIVVIGWSKYRRPRAAEASGSFPGSSQEEGGLLRSMEGKDVEDIIDNRLNCPPHHDPERGRIKTQIDLPKKSKGRCQRIFCRSGQMIISQTCGNFPGQQWSCYVFT